MNQPKQHMTDQRTLDEWLRQYVARCVELPAGEVDADVHLVELGLSSRDAVAMTAELEELTGKLVDPAIVFDYPTIRGLATYLGSDSADQPSGRDGVST